ncbi:MAG: DNA mismatch endonuclease Vsr [Candidatus Delongbacteria bacterium]
MDTLTPAERSEHMSRIRSRDTGPEMVVRQLVHGMGFRYRLHRRELPGCPDLVFNSRRKVIFVHGCFWHAHDGCRNARIPKSNQSFWLTKLAANKSRDRSSLERLVDMGWRVLVLWECELGDMETTASRIRGFLEGGMPEGSDDAIG